MFLHVHLALPGCTCISDQVSLSRHCFETCDYSLCSHSLTLSDIHHRSCVAPSASAFLLHHFTTNLPLLASSMCHTYVTEPLECSRYLSSSPGDLNAIYKSTAFNSIALTDTTTAVLKGCLGVLAPGSLDVPRPSMRTGRLRAHPYIKG